MEGVMVGQVFVDKPCVFPRRSDVKADIFRRQVALCFEIILLLFAAIKQNIFFFLNFMTSRKTGFQMVLPKQFYSSSKEYTTYAIIVSLLFLKKE
jgi:hypothetical protein